MTMSHMCVDLTFVPSGKFIESGFVATLLLSTGVPSIMNIAVAPVSAIASLCRRDRLRSDFVLDYICRQRGYVATFHI
jgi:hypothetical protein